MKLMIDLVSANQIWKADTNTQHNVVVLSIAGVIKEIECTADELGAIIKMAVTGTHPDPLQRPKVFAPQIEHGEDPLESMLAEGGEGSDEIFGGDVENEVTEPPTMFQSEPSLAAAIEEASPPAPTPPKSGLAQRQELIKARVANDPAATRLNEKLVRRARAQQNPPRRVEKDDMGNPVVHASARPITGSAGAPEVVRRPPSNSVGGTDDDGFSQG